MAAADELTARLAVAEAQIEALQRELDRRIAEVQMSAQLALTSVEKAAKLAQETAERAVLKAEVATEKRLENVNEFRATLTDQQKTFVVKSEVDYRFATADKALEEFSRWRRDVDGKLTTSAGRGSGMNAVWGFVTAGVATLAAVAAIGVAMAALFMKS